MKIISPDLNHRYDSSLNLWTYYEEIFSKFISPSETSGLDTPADEIRDIIKKKVDSANTALRYTINDICGLTSNCNRPDFDFNRMAILAHDFNNLVIWRALSHAVYYLLHNDKIDEHPLSIFKANLFNNTFSGIGEAHKHSGYNFRDVEISIRFLQRLIHLKGDICSEK
jgi:hypothetical protein